MTTEPLGLVAAAQDKLASAARVNGHAVRKKIGAPAPTPIPEIHPPRPFPRGRYTSPSVERLIDLVCREAALSRDAILGNRNHWQFVNARSVVASLAEEFAPAVSSAIVESTLNRGVGWAYWVRDRHSDRVAAYRTYAVLYERCRTRVIFDLDKSQ